MAHDIHFATSLLALVFTQEDVHPAIIAMCDCDAASFLQFGCEIAIEARRLAAPCVITVHAHAFRLHPDQAKIAARRAQDIVPII